MTETYRPLLPASTGFLPIRNLRLHLRRWGTPQPGTPPLVLLHGWMDMGASWQFTVDALQALCPDREVLAPDWRGFGQTEGPPTDSYQFDDYLADLDFLLAAVSPGQPVDLVGHSMGGNVAMHYAGARPQRVRRLVNLEGFGMPDVPVAKAPTRHARWMDELAALARGDLALRSYADRDAVAARLRATNPRLPLDKALWLAGEWAHPVPQADGGTRWQLRSDPAHRVVFARIYRVDEVLAHYRAITAPVLMVRATEGALHAPIKPGFILADAEERLKSVPDYRSVEVADAGHMLHHDQPDEVARLVAGFIA